MACGVLLASVFLVLEFRSVRSLEENQELAVLDIPTELTRIRILLKRGGQAPWRIRSKSKLKFKDEDGNRFSSREFTVTTTDGGFRLNGKNTSPSFFMSEDAVFSLNNLSLRGRLHFDHAARSKRPILHLKLEHYLTQVLPGEMPLSYPDEALKAQVIASRSYALSRMMIRRSRKWDLTDGETSQMFQSLSKNTKKSQSIVRRTRGIVLQFEGKVLPAYFSANCGGKTRSNREAFGEALLAPLRGVTCQHCAWSKDHSWTTKVSVASFRRHARIGDAPIRNMTVQAGSGSGYTNKIQCRTASDSTLVAPKVIRRRFGNRKIKSDWVTGIDLKGGSVTIGGRGFGHGVGLCQNGACGLARLGRSAEEILSHYFPNANLARLREPSNP
ncbi:MAG: stage II sporulation protein D [Planctomycetota bacterium]|jgi:stage II sporulation protein D